MIARPEATNGTHTFGEGADNEINIIFKARFISKAATMGTEHTKGMGLISKQLKTMLFLDFNEISQWCAVTEH
jgi:hypothetical protein